MDGQAFIKIDRPPPPPLPPVKPAGFPAQQQQRPQQSMGPPPPPPNMQPGPPREVWPPELRNGPFIEMTDITHDFVSERDMRKALTEIKPIRFEKVQNQEKYDEFGRWIWPGWEKVIKTQVRGQSDAECALEVRRLDLETGHVMTKKNTLPPVLQRQIDIALNQFIDRDFDPVHFQWDLAQYDEHLKRIHNLKAEKKYIFGPKHKHKKGKKKYERLSLTAYFKRSPRAEAPIEMLYREKTRASRGPILHHPAMPPHFQQDQRAFQQPANQPQGKGGPFGPGGPAPGGNRGPGGPPGKEKGGQMKLPMPANISVVKDKKGGKSPVKVYAESRSNSGSDTSDYSDNDSFRISNDTVTDSTSSGSSRYRPRDRSRNRSRQRSRSRTRGRDDGRYYGVGSPRYHSKHEQHYITDTGRLPTVPAPPVIHLTSVGEIEKIKENAYLAGMADQSLQTRLAEERALAEARPRMLPAPRSGARTVLAGGRFSDDDLGRFDRLSMDEHEEFLENLHRRRESEERWLRRDDSLEDEDFVRDLPAYSGSRRRASEYQDRRRASAPQIIHVDREPVFIHPFESHSRRGSAYRP